MQQISLIKKRILEYLDYKGISKYKFYQDSGITRGVLDKDSGITEDNIAKFIAYEPNINLEWLILGKGEIIKKDIVVKENLSEINNYRQIIVDKDKEIEAKNKEIENKNKMIEFLSDHINTLKNMPFLGDSHANAG